MLFVLGIHMPAWLEDPALADVPTMVSYPRFGLRCKTRLPRAVGPLIIDSAGYSQLHIHGEWRINPMRYAYDVRVLQREVGNLTWASPQDWMCEPWVLQKTGLSVAEHQTRTIASVITLRSFAPEVPWIPVLQGWAPEDYLRHRDAYEAAGVHLEREPVVGVGSVCRRGHTDEIRTLARELAGLRLHGFGVKTRAVETAARFFHSTDSMAWSFRARHRPPLPGCSHRNCSNCLRFALWWRAELLRKLDAAKAA